MEQEILDYLRELRAGREYNRGEMIFRQGERADAFFYLESGLSLTFTLVPDGRERNILISWPGRLFGASTFFEKAPRRASAVALETCRVLAIDRRVYDLCKVRFPSFLEAVLLEISIDAGVLFEQLADSALLSADVKVARFICRRVSAGQCQYREGRLMLPYTHSFIAHVLGLSRWSVSQALGKFRERGWLETEYGALRLLDLEAIRRFAYGEGQD